MEKEICNGLIKAANAREGLIDIIQCLQMADTSLSVIEEKAFEAINNSDLVLNFTKEGIKLLDQLSDDYKKTLDNEEMKEENFELKLCEIKDVLAKALNHCYDSNKWIGKMEQQIACQRDSTKEVFLGMQEVMGEINETIACAEVLLMMNP